MTKKEKEALARQIARELTRGMDPEEVAQTLGISRQQLEESMSGELFAGIYRTQMRTRSLAAYAAAVGKVSEMLRSPDSGLMFKGVHEALTQFSEVAEELDGRELRVVLVNPPEMGMPKGGKA